MKPLLQSDIERAIRNTRSNSAAARYLDVHYNTYKKYAVKYYDKDDVNLFEKHKNQAGLSISKMKLSKRGEKHHLEDILDNKHIEYPLQRLKYRLINQGYIEEKCEMCGFHERRLTDNRVPLLLTFTDDYGNYNIENLELLCFNCYFLTVDNIVGRKAELRLNK